MYFQSYVLFNIFLIVELLCSLYPKLCIVLSIVLYMIAELYFSCNELISYFSCSNILRMYVIILDLLVCYSLRGMASGPSRPQYSYIVGDSSLTGHFRWQCKYSIPTFTIYIFIKRILLKSYTLSNYSILLQEPKHLQLRWVDIDIWRTENIPNRVVDYL